jgi:hypothetical protein
VLASALRVGVAGNDRDTEMLALSMRTRELQPGWTEHVQSCNTVLAASSGGEDAIQT